MSRKTLTLKPTIAFFVGLCLPWAAVAQTAPVPEPAQPQPPAAEIRTAAKGASTSASLAVGARIVGEVWEDSNLSLVYRASRAAGTGTLITPLFGPIELAIEAGYVSMSAQALKAGDLSSGSETVRFQLMPLSLLVGYRLTHPQFELALGVGPALTVWNEVTGDSALAGSKIGFAMTTALRIPTRLIQPPPFHHEIDSGPSRVDVELSLGRRQHQAFGLGSGLNLSAWRAGVGLLARF
jgi:hypothetical protein